MTRGAQDDGCCRRARKWGTDHQTELQVSEARYRALYESSFNGVLLTEPDGRILAANPAACRILGRTEAQLQRLTRLDLVSPGDPRTSVLIAERDRSGRYQGELELVRGDGTTFPAEVASAVSATANGIITSMIIRDVSERRRAEARVAEQAQWLDLANESIFVTDLHHRITYWNHGAERMGGWAAADVLGRNLSDVLADFAVADPQVLATARQLTDWRGTVACRIRDGTPQVVATSVTTLRDAHGQPTGRLFICADITEQRRLREQYERALRLQSIGMLAAGVAHDVNNILTPIHLSVPMLRERLSHADDLALLDNIQACVARGAAIVRQILSFSRGTGTEARAIQVKHVLQEVAGIVRETFPRSINLESDVPGDLWPVMADPTRLHQLLLNLCVNARDAMPNGGRLRVGARNCELDEDAAARIEGARAGTWLVLTVEDDGTGIAPELLPRIWDPFVTTKSDGMGTGLGLSAVKDIVETHTGFIAVDTVAGRGTTFRVFLPASVTSTLAADPGMPRELPGGGGERILVVDDEPLIRELTRTALARAGYRVATAANGTAALETIRAHPEEFDLILTDIDMPELNGAQLASAVAAMRPTLPVTAMSGLSSPTAGVDPARFSGGSLAKPFTADELFRTVRLALNLGTPSTSTLADSSAPSVPNPRTD
ncbi:MAG: PAS domain-containing hybrid sensor histidine kinase/response regulator [Gemmatimonadaceae bacterium]